MRARHINYGRRTILTVHRMMDARPVVQPNESVKLWEKGIVMGDTFRDPVDHVRTTRSHAGESLINIMSWPGYLFMFGGVIAVFRCLVALGTGHESRSLVTGVIALAAVTAGLVWLRVERQRIRKIENLWYDAHPDTPWQRPAS